MIGQSKLAMILFSQALAIRIAHRPVFINSLDPGDIDTSIFPCNDRIDLV